MTFTSFFDVCLSFLRLSFGPDYCFFYKVSIISSSPPLAFAFEVCLAELMLTLVAPADLVLGLTLIIAIPELLWVLNVEWFSLKPDIPDPISTFFSPHYILINFFRLVFCQNFCKITQNVSLFCCKFIYKVEEIGS